MSCFSPDRFKLQYDYTATPEEQQRLITYHKNGGVIESKKRNFSLMMCSNWVVDDNPVWDFFRNYYRIR